MKFRNLTFLFIWLIAACAASVNTNNNAKRDPATKVDTLWFSHISMMGMGETPQYVNWEKPNLLGRKAIGYEFLNDSLIAKLNRRPTGELVTVDTLKKLTNFKALPLGVRQLKQSFLDYDLIGIFQYQKLPPDIYISIYYSKARKSLIQQTHVIEMNRVSDVDVLTNGPKNPFAKKHDFKVMVGDERNYVVEIKEKIILSVP